jgi:MFS family permease
MTIETIRIRFARRVERRFFFGWVILFAAGMGIFTSGAGQSYFFSVFIGPIGADLGITSTAVASAYAAATLAAAAGLPFMGRLVDRIGSRATLLWVVSLLGVACIAFGGVAGFVSLALGFAALRFLGQGSMMLNSSVLVSQWFSRKRGFALGLMSLGFSVSLALHPLIAQSLIDQIGWRQTWIWVGISTWALMLPLVILLIHNRPEPLGMALDGQARDAAPDTAPDAYRHRADVGLTLKEAMRTRSYWIVAACLFTKSMMMTTLFFYQVSIFEAQGLDAGMATRIFPLSAITMVLATPLYGRLLDRYPTRYMVALAMASVTLSLLCATQIAGPVSASVYAVVFGLSGAASMTLLGYLWPRYFGLRHIGSIQGAGQTISVVAASLGPLPLAIALDYFSDFRVMLLFLAIQPALCAVLALLLKTPAALRA